MCLTECNPSTKSVFTVALNQVSAHVLQKKVREDMATVGPHLGSMKFFPNGAVYLMEWVCQCRLARGRHGDMPIKEFRFFSFLAINYTNPFKSSSVLLRVKSFGDYVL